ncbi:MAG: ABC transporter substrate-binding protein [Treponema sp.]|jgi:putative aldouronate transport system substrate-binding protein|nr:ABC transporter substrate-binding protein [Treponema sp.]
MKRIVFLWLALLPTFSIFAGGSQGSGGGGPNSGRTDELVMAYVTWGMVSADTPKVEAAINEHLASKNLGIKIKVMPMGMAEYLQRIPLMLTSPAEPLDLFPMMVMAGMSINTHVQQGQVIPLDNLVNQYGQELKKTVGDRYLDTVRINGELYGIPTLKDMARSTGILITREYVDKYQLDLSVVKKLEDFTPLFAKIKQAEPNFYPLAFAVAMDVALAVTLDNLGDYFGVLMGQDRKVVNLFESAEYRRTIAILRSWYQAGYIARDVAAKQESQQSQVRAGTACAWMTSAKPGCDIEEAGSAGHELVLVRFRGPQAATDAIAGVQWVIPHNARNPEKSMQMINLLYTDPVLVNLLNYGIEGAHYVKNPDGSIRYPDGITQETAGYVLDMGWEVGNQFLLYVREGSPLDLWKQLQDFNNSAEFSPAMGFNFDNTPVLTQVAALTALAYQYQRSLETGSVDISVLDEFNARLKQAGLDEVIAEKQRQLDAWFKAKGR